MMKPNSFNNEIPAVSPGFHSKASRANVRSRIRYFAKAPVSQGSCGPLNRTGNGNDLSNIAPMFAGTEFALWMVTLFPISPGSGRYFNPRATFRNTLFIHDRLVISLSFQFRHLSASSQKRIGRGGVVFWRM